MPPSVTHEALVQLFRDRPELAPELLRDALGISLPSFSEVRTEFSDFTQIVPTEYRADLVILLIDGKPVLGIIVEVQLATDSDKLTSWPIYVVALRARLGCPACVLVVTPNEKVAAWASQPIELGPGGRLTPLVLGPSAIPAVGDIHSARREPELAVLSAMAHGHDPDADRAAHIALAALGACLDLDTERAAFYADVVRIALGDAARAALEALMQSPQRREFQSEFARKYVSLGRAEGRTEGQVELLIKLLTLRFGALPEAAVTRVRAASIDELERFAERVLTAETLDDVLG